jgi:hypothetical protein
MADYQILYWDEVPFGVRAYEDNKRVSKQLPMKFHKVIGVLCMVTGRTSQTDYVKGFVWGPRQTREGSAAEVAQQVHDELVAAYPPSRLVEIVRHYKDAQAAEPKISSIPSPEGSRSEGQDLPQTPRDGAKSEAA